MMPSFYYDFHMHSCLSPCGDNDMTPNNIVGMAQLKELDVIAVTDHNSSKNCGAVIEAASKTPLLVLAGMELCTVEEIHAVCLFAEFSDAMNFDSYVEQHIIPFENNTTVYGNQYIMDSNDKIIGEEKNLLINATNISIMKLPRLMKEFGGCCFPAHIDKSSYGILSVLGGLPPECDFKTVEVARPQLTDSLIEKHKEIENLKIITDSDAHYLWDISERYHSLELMELTPKEIIASLSRGNSNQS